MKASLFLATYEMPRHLELVLEGLHRQTTMDFEILICDDGSGPETKAIIEKYQARGKVSIRHFRQENKGFRKCKILNEALRNAKGEVSIFLDGDCVPHKKFIQDHIDQTEEKRFLAGRRVELGPEFSSKLTALKIRQGFLDHPTWEFLKSVLNKDSEHFQRSLHVTFGPLRKLMRMESVDDLKGCNYSVLTKHLFAINGFDEEYEGYGREDTDIEIRLQNLGLQIKSMKGRALQYHVWHPRRGFTPSNDARLEEARQTRRVRCEKGVQV